MGTARHPVGEGSVGAALAARVGSEPCTVVLLWPDGRRDSLVFAEVARLLYHSLRSLGVACQLRVNRLRQRSLNIVLGYNLLANPEVLAPYDTVIYQLEQLDDGQGLFDEQRLRVLMTAGEVWDYSPDNVRFLRERGLSNVKLVPLGSHPRMCTIGRLPGEAEDIDVLFYGSMNARRRRVLEPLAGRCRVETLFGVYAGARDAYIRRAKIVVNLHYYEMQIMEQVRLSYLLNNGRFVVTETAPDDPYQEGLVVGRHDELADICLRYLERPADRVRIAEAGARFMAARPMAGYLAEALGAAA